MKVSSTSAQERSNLSPLYKTKRDGETVPSYASSSQKLFVKKLFVFAVSFFFHILFWDEA
jgi:hypothetical protein